MTERSDARHTRLWLLYITMQPTISTFFKTKNKRSISPIDLTGDNTSPEHVSKKPKHLDPTQLDQWSFTSSAPINVESPEVNQHKRVRHELFKNKLHQTDLSSWHKESSQNDTHLMDGDRDEGEERREPSARSHRAPAVKTRVDVVGKPYTPLEMQVGLTLLSSSLYNHNAGTGV
jgi:hypothetical protein